LRTRSLPHVTRARHRLERRALETVRPESGCHTTMDGRSLGRAEHAKGSTPRSPGECSSFPVDHKTPRMPPLRHSTDVRLAHGPRVRGAPPGLRFTLFGQPGRIVSAGFRVFPAIVDARSAPQLGY